MARGSRIRKRVREPGEPVAAHVGQQVMRHLFLVMNADVRRQRREQRGATCASRSAASDHLFRGRVPRPVTCR
jgi:hypothetical protein